MNIQFTAIIVLVVNLVIKMPPQYLPPPNRPITTVPLQELLVIIMVLAIHQPTMPNKIVVVHILNNNNHTIVITIIGSTIQAIVVMANGVVIQITIKIKYTT